MKSLQTSESVQRNVLHNQLTMDGTTVIQRLVEEHFGNTTDVSPEVIRFIQAIQAQLGAAIVRDTNPSAYRPLSAPSFHEDMLVTMRNLQNLVIKLRRKSNGTIVYVLREGKLAGDLTTEHVYDKTPVELFGEEVAKVTMPNVERAFSGLTTQFEYTLQGKHFLTLLEPVFDKNGQVKQVVGSMIDITKQKQSELQLRDSEQLFKTLIECLPVGILKQETRGDGKVYNEVANAEFRRITGYTIDELWDLTPEERLEIIHIEDREEALRLWQEWASSAGSGVLNLKYRYKQRMGTFRWLDNYMSKFPAINGSEVIVQAVIDITERHDTEMKLRHFASFLQQSDVPIFEVRPNGEVLYCNPTAQNLYPELRTLHSNHALLEGYNTIVEAMNSKQVKIYKRQVVFKNEYFDQHFYYMPEVEVFRVFCYNITVMKKAEQELLETLEKERAINVLRTRFINTISHEFRTPLTGIQTATDLLLRYNNTMSGEQQSQQVRSINQRVAELVGLVDTFTTQTSLSTLRDTFTPVSVDMAVLLKSTIEEVRSRTVDKSQKLLVEFDVTQAIIHGDEKLLRHALRNVLTNASVYSPSGSEIHVKLFQCGKNFLITVKDNGAGIPSNELNSVFTPYFRGSNVDGNTPGSGLGLSVTKEFVELHNGRIDIQSVLNEGTTVTITFPMVFERTNNL
ncbi:MAG: ATP-binding protein [Candidatus Kapaibacterium sp.]